MDLDRSQYYNDAEEAMRLVLDGRQSTIWTALPCTVQSVDFTTMTIEAQPTIQGAVNDENGNVQFVNLPLLLDVPIVFPSAGGFTITLPISIGDEVLVVFSSRCMDAWFQSGGIQKPMEARMHDLSDGFCIPGPKSLPNVVPGISTTGAQIRNNAGTTYIEISSDGKIKLVSPSEIDITGNLKVSGNINAANVVATGEVTAGLSAIPLSTHLHGGVTTGGGDTGVPLP